MKEIWKDIPGFEGMYQASSLGRIKSLNRIIHRKTRWGGYCDHPLDGRVIKFDKKICGAGYYNVSLGRRRDCMVHTIVCETFHGKKPGPKYTVNHKNGNKLNNSAKNL